MKLNYKILWVDDNIENYLEAGINTEFEDFLLNLGFNPTVACFETGEKALHKLSEEKFDLILSDYEITGGEQGDTLINRIRKGDIFTEILFYSAKPNFDEIAKNLYQDRVSFLSLVGDEGFRQFKSKVQWLVNLSISKLQELNSIRGLVMAETSELDNIVEDILISYLSVENEDTSKLRKYIIKCVKESIESNSKNATKLDSLDNQSLIKSRLLDADKKSRAINKLLEIIKLNGEEPFTDFYQKYKTQVIDNRNDLAHAKSENIDGVDYLIISRKDGEKSIKYDQPICVEIRKNLTVHNNTLKQIRQKVQEIIQ